MAYQNPMLDHAVAYADAGWPVFPVHYPIHATNNTIKCSCQAGVDCRHIGKHPATKNGLNAATNDPDIIARMWGNRPYNIGAPTGIKFDVLDDDPAHGGDDSLAALAANGNTIPNTVTSKTGGGGSHFLFQPIPGVKNNNTGKVAPGLDFKTQGGYIVVPPSLHKSGARYEWSNLTTEIAPAPAWLIEILQREFPAGKQPKRTDEYWQNLAGEITAGDRHNAIASLAGRLIGDKKLNIDPVLAVCLVHGYNLYCCKPPKSKEEVDGIIQYVLLHTLNKK